MRIDERDVPDAASPTANRAPADSESLRRHLVGWLREQVEAAGVDGVVFGLSGGIDSAVVCGLCAEAIGPDRCFGLILPIESQPLDERLAKQVAERFGVACRTLALEPAFDALLGELEDAAAPEVEAASPADPRSALARANVKPRLRMIALYWFANRRNAVVIGTGNAAERLVGYFTKWGDGAADLAPLAGLLKREVRDLARVLGVPAPVIERPPTAGLWAGQTDEQELGLAYDQIDRFLAEGSSGDEAADREIARRARATRHKLESVPVPPLE